MTHILDTYHGGGLPHRVVSEFKDAIAPLGESALCRALADLRLERPVAPLIDFMFRTRRLGPIRVFENGVVDRRQMLAFETYFPVASLAFGAAEPAVFADASARSAVYRNSNLRWMWRMVSIDAEDMTPLYDLIISTGPSEDFLAESWTMLRPRTGFMCIDGIDAASADHLVAIVAPLPMRGVLVQLDTGNLAMLLERRA